MQNDQQPAGQWTGAQPPQPAVTISQAEYDSLRQQAAQAPAQYPATPTPAPAADPNAYPLRTAKTTMSEKIWFVLALGILVSIFVNRFSLLFLPIILFAALAGQGFVRDASHHSKTAKGAFLLLKVIAILGIGAFIVIYGAALLLLAALFFGGGHMG